MQIRVTFISFIYLFLLIIFFISKNFIFFFCRISSSQEDPSSQPRIQRKRSVHFDVSPSRGNPASPMHTKQASPGSSSPSMPTWNLEHPAVNHDESMPSRGLDESKIQDEGDEEQIHHPDGKVISYWICNVTKFKIHVLYTQV